MRSMTTISSIPAINKPPQNQKMMQEHLSIQNATRATTAWAGSPVGRLIRVEVLVTLTLSLLVTLVFLSSGRRTSRRPAFRFVVWLALILSYPAVSYTTGLMQSSTFHNELVVVWACFLLGCADGIAACSVDGSDQQARTMLNQAAQIVYVLFLLLSYPSSLHLQIRVVLFLFWMLNVVKLSMRLWGFLLQGSREHTLAVENRFITRTDRLVLIGEVDGDGEAGSLEDGRRGDGDVDIQRVKECDGALLSSDNLKDLCLSFAMFKQLLRRFTGCYPSSRKRYQKRCTHQKWNPPGDIELHEWEYRITEVELGFLFDFFYARHPSLRQTLIPETLVFSAAVTLSLCALFSPALLRYRGPDGDDAHVSSSAAAVATGFDIWLTRLTIVLFVMVDSFQYMKLLFSDWHKVSLACRYVRHPQWRGQPIMERLLGFICSFTLTTRYWSNSVGQYSLLGACIQSQNSFVPRLPFLLPKRVRGMLFRRSFVSHQDLPMPAKRAVYHVLRDVCDIYPRPSLGAPDEYERRRYNINHGVSATEDLDLALFTGPEHPLSKEILEGSIFGQGIIRSMLIWHIATTVCDYKQTSQSQQQVGTTAFLDENKLVATTLSDYSSYLLFYATELVMENFHSTQLFLEELQVHAQQCLVGCRSKDAVLDRLSCLGKDGDKYEAILADGIKLADQLMNHFFLNNNAALWELLAKVWVEKLLSVTPSNNLTAHINKLATGGEYITHLWVLLTHKRVLEPAPLYNKHADGPGGGPWSPIKFAEELL